MVVTIHDAVSAGQDQGIYFDRPDRICDATDARFILLPVSISGDISSAPFATHRIVTFSDSRSTSR